MSAFSIIAVLLAAALVIVIIISGALVRVATARFILGKRHTDKAKNKKKSNMPEQMRAFTEIMKAEGERFMAQNPERVTIESYDGLKLSGLYLGRDGATQAILLMHGFRSSSGLNDFAPLISFYEQRGLSILVIDQRAHGQSEGKRICFGVKERYDCQSWLRWLNERAMPKDLYLGGLSMGAATVLMAAELELPNNLRGIIADCGYTSPWDICGHALKTMYHLPMFLLTAANLGVRLAAGYSLREASAKSAMAANERIPVLFIHGGSDKFVPTEMGRENYNACKAPKRLYIVPAAEHATSSWLDPDGVKAQIADFMDEYGSES